MQRKERKQLMEQTQKAHLNCSAFSMGKKCHIIVWLVSFVCINWNVFGIVESTLSADSSGAACKNIDTIIWNNGIRIVCFILHMSWPIKLHDMPSRLLFLDFIHMWTVEIPCCAINFFIAWLCVQEIHCIKMNTGEQQKNTNRPLQQY